MNMFDALNPSPTAAQERERTAHNAAVRMLVDAIEGLPPASVAAAVYVALSDRADIPADHLDDLANKIGRIAHERARHD